MMHYLVVITTAFAPFKKKNTNTKYVLTGNNQRGEA